MTLRPVTFGVCLAAVAAACSRGPAPAPIAPTVAAAAGTTLPSVWAFPGSDVPAFCLLLRADGRAEFLGGFRYLNPVRWTWSADHLFTLTVPAFTARDTAALAEQVANGSLLGYDMATKTMRLALHPEADALPLLGYVLLRPDRLTADQRAVVRRRCPVLPR